MTPGKPGSLAGRRLRPVETLRLTALDAFFRRNLLDGKEMRKCASFHAATATIENELFLLAGLKKNCGDQPPQSKERWRIFGVLWLDEAFFLWKCRATSLRNAGAFATIELQTLARAVVI